MGNDKEPFNMGSSSLIIAHGTVRCEVVREPTLMRAVH